MKKYLAWIIILGVVELCLALYLTSWRHLFWDFVAAKNYRMFIEYLGIFTVVASVMCIISAWAGYIQSLITIKWRKNLNEKARHCINANVANVHQRIQGDCRDYPDLVTRLGYGLGKAVVYFFVFAVTLVIQFSWSYLVWLIVFALASTIISRWIAKPLIKLNYDLQSVEATYRTNITKSNFQSCIRNMLSVAKKTKVLQYFIVMYDQIGVILPLIIIAPDYFGGILTIGALMQASSIMGQITVNLGYGIDYFGSINQMISVRRRLLELGVLQNNKI